MRKHQIGLRDSGDKGNEKNHVYYLGEDLKLSRLVFHIFFVWLKSYKNMVKFFSLLLIQQRLLILLFLYSVVKFVLSLIKSAEANRTSLKNRKCRIMTKKIDVRKKFYINCKNRLDIKYIKCKNRFDIKYLQTYISTSILKTSVIL